ncbi:hypothetical protein V8E36_008451 [Tilletia maclaganii]
MADSTASPPGASSSMPLPDEPASNTTARDTVMRFAATLFDARKRAAQYPLRSQILSNPRASSSSSSSAAGKVSTVPATVTTSDLRSLAASRKMIRFLASLPAEQYEDAQLLVERAYQLYRAEYGRAWRDIAGAAPGTESSDEEEHRPISANDALMLHGFLTAVLDWAPFSHHQALLDEDEDAEARAVNEDYDRAHRDLLAQLSGTTSAAAQSGASASNEAESSSAVAASPSSAEAISKNRDLLRARAQAFEKLLDLTNQDAASDSGISEQLKTVVQISGQPFLLSLDCSPELLRKTKYLHLLAKRAIFLLESAYRLRIIVHYAKNRNVRAPLANVRLHARFRIWRLIDLIQDIPSPFEEAPGNLLAGAGATTLLERLRRDQAREYRQLRGLGEDEDDGGRKDDSALGAYKLDVFAFNHVLRRQLEKPHALDWMEDELGGAPASASASAGISGIGSGTGRSRGRGRPSPHHRPRARAAETPNQRQALERLQQLAPVNQNAQALAAWWAAARRAFPDLIAPGPGDDEPPVDVRQIFQRRPREAPLSLRQLVLSLIPRSVQTAIYNAVVPAPVRLLISSPEARALLPQLLMHSGWLLFKIFIFMSVLSARLRIPIPAFQQGQQQRRAQQALAQARAQAQGEQGAGGLNARELYALSTLIGWLHWADWGLDVLGLPPLSIYWQLYGICFGATLFVLMDMERFLNRRLESQRREQRRNLRANQAAGRAPPPARNVPPVPAAPEGAVVGEGAGAVEGGAGRDQGSAGSGAGAAGTTAADPTRLPPAPPLRPPPIYAPRRITVFSRQRRDPNQRFGLVLAASLGPAPLLTYLLERLAYIGLEREDAELGLIPRSQMPAGFVVDDATGVVRSVYSSSLRAMSSRAALRLTAPATQVERLYEDIESEYPTVRQRSGRYPLTFLSRALVQDNPQIAYSSVLRILAFEAALRLGMAFVLLWISLVPECEILRRKAIDRRTEVWRNARRKEVERRQKEAEWRAEIERIAAETDEEEPSGGGSGSGSGVGAAESDKTRVVGEDGSVLRGGEGSSSAANTAGDDGGLRRRTALEREADE